MNLARYTSLGVGGSPSMFHEPETEAMLIESIAEADRANLPLHILGGGSNTLFAEGELAIAVIRPTWRGIRIDGSRLTAAAGEAWDTIVSAAVSAHLQGIECLSGIPGTAGAAPIQNIGAYGQQVSDTISSVRVFDRQRSLTRELSVQECSFGYRTSRFKQKPDQFVVLDVTFALTPYGDPLRAHAQIAERTASDVSLTDVRAAVLTIRREKGMLRDQVRSAGSFFMNPVVPAALAESIAERFPAIRERAFWPQDGAVKLSAAFLMERSGIPRGYHSGNVGTSEHHTLAIMTYPGASASDVIALARDVQQRVLDCCGVLLQPEVQMVGFAEYPLLR